MNNNEVNETNNVQTNVDVEAASTEQPVVNQNVNPTVEAATAQPTVEVENKDNNKKKKTTQIILAVVASILVIVCAYVIVKSNFINEFFNSNKKENNSGVVEPQGEQQTEKQDEPPVVTPTEDEEETDEEEDEEYDEEDEDEEEVVEVEKFEKTFSKSIEGFDIKIIVSNSYEPSHFIETMYINDYLVLDRKQIFCNPQMDVTSEYVYSKINDQLEQIEFIYDSENDNKYIGISDIEYDQRYMRIYNTNGGLLSKVGIEHAYRGNWIECDKKPSVSSAYYDSSLKKYKIDFKLQIDENKKTLTFLEGDVINEYNKTREQPGEIKQIQLVIKNGKALEEAIYSFNEKDKCKLRGSV